MKSVSESWFEGDRFREVADAAPVGLWRINATFEQDWVNKHWLDFTGGRLEDEVGFAWVEKVHPEDRTRVVDAFDRAFDAREATDVEFRLRGKDGQYRWFLDSGVPYHRDGEFLGFVGVCRDVTDQRMARMYLKMSGMAATGERTPNAIALPDIGNLPDTGQMFAEIGIHAEQLERLIEARADLPVDLMNTATSLRLAADRGRDIVRDFGRALAAGAIAGERVNIATVVRDIKPLVQMHPWATAATVKWDVGADLIARVSAAQLQQVLIGAVLNGLRDVRGVREQVLVVSATRWGGVAVVSVAGRGGRSLEHISDEGSCLSDGEYAAGVGLDLYFCRLIVATNGGRMWVDENPGGGSILRFTVPLYEPALSASV